MVRAYFHRGKWTGTGRNLYGNGVTGTLAASALTSPQSEELGASLCHRPKSPKLHAQMSKQANVSAVSTRTFKRRRPSGYSLLYSRWSRWRLDQYQPSSANCSAFGSLPFTLSTISKFAKVATRPQIEIHASATIPTMTRVDMHAHSKPSKPGNHGYYKQLVRERRYGRSRPAADASREVRSIGCSVA